MIQTLGNIWNTVWSAVGPILQTAWAIIKPILDGMASAINAVCGFVNGLVYAFKALAEVFRSGGVQEALSNSSAANGNNTYQSTQPNKPKAFGMQRIPYDGYQALLHQGEAVLTRRDADQWRKGQDNSTITIAKIADTVVIREEADINKITAGIVRKINQQKIII